MTSLPDSNTPAHPSPMGVDELLSLLLADIEARREAAEKGYPLGPRTGFPALDEELGGYLAPGVHVMHGDPGAGKTALALQIAAQCGTPALYVTAEVAPIEIMRRLLACWSRTPLRSFKGGTMPPEDLVRHISTMQKELLSFTRLDAPPFRVLDATAAPVPYEVILEGAREVKSWLDHVLVVVDSLHSWAMGLSSKETEYALLGEAWASVRRLSSDLQCPVLVIAERNRSSRESTKTRQDKAMEAAAGHRAAEYGAETMLSLNVTSEEDSDEPPSFTASDITGVKVKIVKNRHGSAGKSIHLDFHHHMQRFLG